MEARGSARRSFLARLLAVVWPLLPGALPATVPAQQPSDTICPSTLPAESVCAGGRDANGSYYFLAKPSRWNGVLVVYDHGGPNYNVPPSLQSIISLAGNPWIAARVRAGYAMAIPSYRDQYWNIDRYADDNESARTLFTAHFGPPARTLLEGTSFGAEVAARTIERFRHSYDGALLVAGVVAGSLLDTYLHFDTRVVYQYYCHNLPKPDEPQYPLWRGWYGTVRLPGTVDSLLTVTFPTLVPRVRECTGFDLPDSARSPEQRRAYRNIRATAHVDSADFRPAIGSAAMLYTIQAVATGGRNVFDNQRAVYAGSDDDAALNQGVTRYAADSAAARAFYDMTTPTGAIDIPVLTSHSIHDPRVPVEEESFYRHAVERAGRSRYLVQVFTTHPNHPGTSAFENVALLDALDEWVRTHHRPDARQVTEQCEQVKPAGQTCTFLPSYTPKPLSAILPAQGREQFLPPGW